MARKQLAKKKPVKAVPPPVDPNLLTANKTVSLWAVRKSGDKNSVQFYRAYPDVNVVNDMSVYPTRRVTTWPKGVSRYCDEINKLLGITLPLDTPVEMTVMLRPLTKVPITGADEEDAYEDE